MLPLLNSFDEAATPVELTHEAEEALRGVDAIAQRAAGVKGRVDAEGGEARQRFQDLVQRLQKAAARVESAGDAAAASFDEVAARAADTQESVGGLLTTVKHALGELDATARRLSGALDRDMDVQEESYERVAHNAERLQTEIDGHRQADFR
jgi:methyl-accepting chemotaxis protein